MWLYSRDWYIINQLNCNKNKTDNNNNKKPQTSQKPHNSHLLGCTFFFSWHLVASSWGQDLCQSHCYTDESPGQCQGLKDFYENVWIEQVNGWVIEKSKGILGKNRQPPQRPGEQEVTLTNRWRKEWQPLCILALRTPRTVWKGKKVTTLKDELPRSGGAQYTMGEE